MLFNPDYLSRINEVRVCDFIPLNNLGYDRAVLFGDPCKVVATLNRVVDLFGFGGNRCVAPPYYQLLSYINEVGVGEFVPLHEVCYRDLELVGYLIQSVPTDNGIVDRFFGGSRRSRRLCCGSTYQDRHRHAGSY